MQRISINKSVLAHPLRLAIALGVCIFLLFSQGMPAYSATSAPQAGEASLNQIEKESQKIIRADKPVPSTLEETTKRAQQGINEVQGSGDAEKMSRPENTQQEESVEKKLDRAFKNIKGQD